MPLSVSWMRWLRLPYVLWSLLKPLVPRVGHESRGKVLRGTMAYISFDISADRIGSSAMKAGAKSYPQQPNEASRSSTPLLRALHIHLQSPPRTSPPENADPRATRPP